MNQKTSFKSNTFYAVIVLFFTQNMFAANFTIAPFGTLPTTVPTGQSVSANYTVTNMTSTTRNGYVLTGFPTTVTQNTTSPNCTNPINLGPNANCNLQLDITGAVSSNFAICKGSSCTATTTPLNVTAASGPRNPRFAYVANSDTPYSVVVCPFSTDGVTLMPCSDTNLNATNYPSFSYPQGITFNNDASKAYITTYTSSGGDPSAWECTVNPLDGSFLLCTPYVITSPINYFQAYGMIAVNNAKTTAYIVDYYGADVLLCPISVNGSFSSSVCTSSGLSSFLSNPVGIALDNAGTTAFIANSNSNGVSVCTINNGLFTGCVNKNGDGVTTFSDVYDVALNSTGTLVYITEPYSNNVYACTPSFSSCSNVNGGNTFNTPYGIVLNSAGTMAYITSYNGPGGIYQCPIKNDGSFDLCGPAYDPGSLFIYPSAITLVY